ncbi:hypothetical protein NPIL_160601 [Nephila pilipes]|uniref:Uncharacterized protein n=1 Tax=Nephila pilipes TaxID=299642 RepID=A0A8X6N3X6_NEPPI|nr:hypothetical protein NPIL_160601 [Nephila pilipes]
MIHRYTLSLGMMQSNKASELCSVRFWEKFKHLGRVARACASEPKRAVFEDKSGDIAGKGYVKQIFIDFLQRCQCSESTVSPKSTSGEHKGNGEATGSRIFQT